MKNICKMTLLCMIPVLFAPLAAHATGASGFHGGINMGYTGGFGIQATGTFMNFTRDVPLSARFTLGYNSAGAGDPYAARQVFINDNTNGDPEKGAHTWQARFDLMIPAFHLGPQQVLLFAGPRYASYTATYDFVGGNETFDVKSSPWGAGLGFETWFVINDKTDFVMQLGLDWYADSKIEGHDTAYYPSGDDVNPRDDYTWDDADEAIDQPKWEILGMVGLLFAF